MGSFGFGAFPTPAFGSPGQALPLQKEIGFPAFCFPTLTAANCEIGQVQTALASTINLYVLGVEDQQKDEIIVVCESERIPISRKLACKYSEFMKASLSSGMRESATDEIVLHDTNPKMFRLLVVIWNIGPSYPGNIPIPTLTSLEAYQLMELSTRLLMPAVCSKLAGCIDQFTQLDVKFYLAAEKQKKTSGNDFQEAWNMVCKKALDRIPARIEDFCKDQSFGDLPFDIFEDIIDKMDSDAWPSWSNQPVLISPGFEASVTDNEKQINVVVRAVAGNWFGSASAACPITFGDRVVAMYEMEVRSEGGFSRTLQCQTPSFTSSYGWNNKNPFIKEAERQSARGAAIRISFRARRVKLHRQCVALLKYAEHNLWRNQDDRSANGSDLPFIEALKFYQNANGKPAEKLFNVILECAARSFDALRASKSFMGLDIGVLKILLGKDFLSTAKNEGMVLDFLCARACENLQSLVREEAPGSIAREEAAGSIASEEAAGSIVREKAAGSVISEEVGAPQQPLAECESRMISAEASNGQGRTDPQKDAMEDTTKKIPETLAKELSDLEQLLPLVRFPFISMTRLFGEILDSNRRNFMREIPLFRELVKEATEAQLRKVTTSTQDPIRAKRCTKRVDYDDIPSLDVEVLMDFVWLSTYENRLGPRGFGAR